MPISSEPGSGAPENTAAPRVRNRGAGAIALRVFHVFWKAFWSVVLVGVITGIICGVAVLAYLFSIKDTKIDVPLKSLSLNQTSYVYTQNSDGEWTEHAQFHGVENREWVDLDKVPKNLINAFISTEDKRFRTHHGVDWIRTGFAVLNTFTSQSSVKQGGSTLTQQLIKNLTNDDSVSINRKLREIFEALNLEKEYSKDEILEAYLNLINLGNGAYGVQAAAESYFNKDVSELTLMECAAIAGITQNPYSYNPVYYPNNNTTRRNEVLYNMYNQGYISKDEYLATKYTKLKLNPGSAATSATAVVDWYTDMVREDVLNDLVNKRNYNEKAASSLLYQGGLKIYSAVDSELQDICEKYYITNADSLISGKPDLQSSVFCMNYQGRVLATVGRRGEKTGNRLYSLATNAQRQPGSSIKPISVYSPAIEYGMVDWSTIIEDEPITLPNGSKYPVNSYGTYYGPMTLQQGLEISANAVSVHIVEDYLTIDKAFQFAKYKYHLNSLYEKYTYADGSTDTDLTLSSMAVGGTLIGTTVKEMTEAYAVFGNGGRYYDAYSYYYVEDNDGNIILDNRDPQYEQTISEGTAGVMSKLLQAVVQNKGPYWNTARAAQIPGWEVYGKTGTTNDYKDRWFMAGNPYCVAGVWCGYDPARYIQGEHYSVYIWQEIMADYLANKEKKTFGTSDSIVQRWYCTESGELATSACPNAKQGWYKKDSTIRACSKHTGGYVIRPGATWTKPASSEVSSSEASSDVSSSASSNASGVPNSSSSTAASSTTTSAPSSTPGGTSTSENTEPSSSGSKVE